MNGRTDFAALRTEQLAKNMGARLGQPAEANQLDDVPTPMHPGDLAVCIVGVILIIVSVGWLL